MSVFRHCTILSHWPPNFTEVTRKLVFRDVKWLNGCMVFITKKVGIFPYRCDFWSNLNKSFTGSLFPIPITLPNFVQFCPVSEEIYPKMSSRLLSQYCVRPVGFSPTYINRIHWFWLRDRLIPTNVDKFWHADRHHQRMTERHSWVKIACCSELSNATKEYCWLLCNFKSWLMQIDFFISKLNKDNVIQQLI